ncbi:MAG: hypothetical protein EPN45_11835 [Rhizobiaceae bacterium]|nr:MAG: hypothetical protein EPN45_11835 [Rhizobiaceae bacterium]
MKAAPLLLAGLLILPGGCAYRPLKAPCSPDDAPAPLAYTGATLAPPADKALDTVASCGPMRPI